MELLNAKGTRDLAPEDKILRQNMTDAFRRIFERYGYNPIEAPVIERLDVLSAKYAGGEEILKETFKLKDQGDRDLCLRYDLTVPFARFVGMNPTMKMPFKRYQIDRVFRDGPIKAGRLREFWQCDVDCVGLKSMKIDAECIMIAQDLFGEIGLDVVIKVNNRKILDGIMETLKIPESKWIAAILAIDKLEKFGRKTVSDEFLQKGLSKDQSDKLLGAICLEGTNDEKLQKLKEMMNSGIGLEGLKEIEEVLSYVDQKNVDFCISLARGLAYYTGTVFEVFLSQDQKEKGQDAFTSSLAGGGRYDRMIGSFLGGKKDFPAVGISFGIEPITTVLKKSAGQKKTVAKVYVVPINTFKQCLEIARKLRKNGINTDIDLADKGVSKNLNYANSMGIPFTIIVGENELANNRIKLKDMVSGEEKEISVDEAVERLR